MQHGTDMRRALGAALRKAFPAPAAAASVESSIADLLGRLDRVGADRPRPFRHDQEQHR